MSAYLALVDVKNFRIKLTSGVLKPPFNRSEEGYMDDF